MCVKRGTKVVICDLGLETSLEIENFGVGLEELENKYFTR